MEPSSERAFNAAKQFVLDMLPSCRQIARESQLTTTDLQLLHLIHLLGERVTASRLCSLSGLPSSTMTRILDRLESGAYIYRSPDPHDRRIRLIKTLPDRLEPIISHFDSAKQILEAELAAYPENMLGRMLEFFSGVTAIQLRMSLSLGAPAGTEGGAR